MAPSLTHATQWPVWPFNNNANQHRVVQDYGCIGKNNIFSGTIDDICFKADLAHTGIDIGCETAGCPYPAPTYKTDDRTQIKSVEAGTVLCTKNDCADSGNKSCNHGYGNTVAVDCGPNCVDIYGHMMSGTIKVKKGDFLTEGTKVGVIGKSGGADGIHLHYERRNEDPANAAICKSDPMPTAGYVAGHPAEYDIIDPWTVLGTFDYRLLAVSANPAKIRRGPGKKYSVFGQASKNQTYVAFTYVDVTEEDYDLNMTIMRQWLRVDLPPSEESSVAGWIAEDDVINHDLVDTIANYVGGPTCFPIVFIDTNGGGVRVRASASSTAANAYSAKTGAHQIYGAAGFPVKGDGTICTCWFPIHRPELVYSKDQSIGWICGGTPAEGDWVLPSCSAYFPSSSVSIPQDITLAGTKISVDVDIPPPPSEPVPPPYIPQGASLTVTTRDSPMQMETLVQGGVQGTVSHTANVWLEYGASATSVTETVHRSVSAGSFSETFDLPVSAGCGATITYRGVAELVATDIISYGTWKNASTLPCPVAPSTTPFSITVTPSCPDGVTATERITWEDQQAAQYEVYMDGVRANDVIYQVAVGTTHTFLVKAYFSNGTSLFSKSLTYTLDKNPCTGPVFPAREIPTHDLSADTFIADVLDPVYIQKLGGSATTLDPNAKLRLYTATGGDTGSVETKIFPFNPALPLVMERQVMVSNLDKSPCFLTTNTGQSVGVVHVVKAAGTYCGSGRAPSATFHAGEVNSLACGLDLHAAIPTGSPFRELFLFEPTGHAYLFINGILSAMANLPPLAPHATELSLYCHAERSAGGEVTSDYWYLWQEGGGTQKSLTADTTKEPTPALAEQAPEPIAEPVLDATTSASNTTASNTLSFFHTSSGTNRLLAVTVSTAADVEAVRSITYDNLPLARAVGVDQMGRLSQIWYLLGQPTGAHTVAISTVGSGRIIATALSFAGVAQTNVLGATATATGFDATPTVDLQTKQQGSILIDSLVLNFESGSPVATKVQIVRSNLKGYSGIQHATSTKMGGGAGTHTMSWVSSGTWGISTAEFKAVVP